MPQLLEDKTIFSLKEVSQSIKKTIALRYKQSYWVKAEMNKLNYYSHSGHCYPELLEKQNGKVVAQMKSTLWRNDYQRINHLFLQTLNEPLKDGIIVLLCVQIQFDDMYGVSLKIIDIDPVFSLGELEREKQECIQKLKSEGIYGANKSKDLALLPQRIAIISVETSKGYADFLKVIENNSWGYAFYLQLFPALLQGDKSIDSIVRQLQRIEKVKNHFDVVAIIRGGGGDVGLASYNNYKLCKHIAEFPLPVITGIGHSTNETVSEMIAYYNAITPTELGDFLLQHFHNFSIPVQKAEEMLSLSVSKLLKDKRQDLASMSKSFNQASNIRLQSEKFVLHKHTQKFVDSCVQQINMANRNNEKAREQLSQAAKNCTTQHAFSLVGVNAKLESASHKNIINNIHFLHQFERGVELMDPQKVLQRGYSITLLNGKAINAKSKLEKGMKLQTKLFGMEIESSIDSHKKTTNE